MNKGPILTLDLNAADAPDPDRKAPFEYGRELGIDEIVDRQDEVAEVVRTIRDGGKLFLIGPRRYGKSSILKTAVDHLNQKSAIILRIDAEGYPSIDLIVGAIIALAAQQLTGEAKKAGSLIAQFFSRIRPELEYNPLENTWSARLGVDIKRHDHTHLLVEALNSFERLAQAQPERRPVGLIIDEFQKIIELGGQTAEGQIRAAIQTHKRAGYVFAGSKTHMLTAMTTDAARPFYRLGGVRFIGPVPRDDFHRFIKERFKASGFTAKDEAITLLMDLAHDVPYNIQMLAHGCWASLRNSGTRRATLTPEIVAHTLRRLVLQQDPIYTMLWNRLTSIQQRTLIAVIRLQGRNLQSARGMAIVGKAPATIRKSIHAMMDTSLLRDEQTPNSTVVVFEDPFFEKWIEFVILPNLPF